MTKNTKLRPNVILGILLSISIVVAGICLIVSCLTIYSAGDHSYSREAVANAFSKIAVPVYICLTLTVISFVFEFLFPSAAVKGKITKNHAHILNRLSAKKDVVNCDNEICAAILTERKNRKLHTLIRTVLICLGCAIFLIYALNTNNYQSDINSSVIRAMWVLIPCLAVPFAYSVFTSYYVEKSIQREIELLKQAPTATEDEFAEDYNFNNKILNILRLVLLVAGIVILIYGFITGGTADVLTKAINICTECIGLG